MQKINKTLIMKILLIIILIIGSCQKDNSDNDSTSLINRWRLIQVEKISTKEIFDNPNAEYPIITFTDSDTVKCNGGCNTGVGTYSVNKNQIFIECAMTKMLCPSDETMDWESIFQSNLFLSKEYKIDRNKLIIYTTGEYNLIFIQLMEILFTR